ncbi:MAG: potassium-transporting ATPase A chain [Nitrospira sp.]|jgi:K+-transporting ATPase ATPase A chain|nr:MAG: potassium-transporting ATPase A chain [Nitrospira sp.]
MTPNGLFQIGLFFLVLLASVKPLGWYMALVYEGRPTPLDPVLGPIERAIYRLGAIRATEEMDWKVYSAAMLLFSAASVFSLYLLQRLQAVLPLNPHGFESVPADLAFNTAISYVTNTNWQAYTAESTMSHLNGLLGMTVQNFAAAATGMACLVALIRGFARRHSESIGNFWVDLVRSTLYILLPIAFVSALILISEGAVQTLDGTRRVTLLQPVAYDRPVTDATGQPVADAAGRPQTEPITIVEQILAVGPAATQVISRDIGTSGGGFFNVNSAHPFESPTPLSDLLLLLLQTMLAAAFTYTFGTMVGDTRQGWAILTAMVIVLGGGVLFAYQAEVAGNPGFAVLGVDQAAGEPQPGGNMEGKELRFGVARTALVAAVTTGSSTGAANGMHDSLTPLGGLVALVMMQCGEVLLGGVGTGLAGMLVLVIIAVFVAGLMIGRTPEYLGKPIEAYDIKMVSVIMLAMPTVVLGFTALAVVTEGGTSAIFNPGPHGFSEVLYAYTSMGNNNGSTFGGLNANTPFYNVTGGIAMLIGRFWLAVPTLALAGSLARKTLRPSGSGNMPTHTPVFVVLLIMIVILVGVLAFLPGLALGPIVEHMLMMAP